MGKISVNLDRKSEKIAMTSITLSDAYPSCSGAVHVTDNGRTYSL